MRVTVMKSLSVKLIAWNSSFRIRNRTTGNFYSPDITEVAGVEPMRGGDDVKSITKESPVTKFRDSRQPGLSNVAYIGVGAESSRERSFLLT
jgi:hypothetical protein